MLEQQNQQMADQLRSEYNTKMADQQVELMAEYERDKKSLYEEGELEIRRYQDQMNIMIANRRNEVSPTPPPPPPPHTHTLSCTIVDILCCLGESVRENSE